MSLNRLNKKNLIKDKFDLNLFNSLLHPDLMKENNDQLILLKNLVLISLIKKKILKRYTLKQVLKILNYLLIFIRKKNNLNLKLGNEKTHFKA